MSKENQVNQISLLLKERYDNVVKDYVEWLRCKNLNKEELLKSIKELINDMNEFINSLNPSFLKEEFQELREALIERKKYVSAMIKQGAL